MPLAPFWAEPSKFYAKRNNIFTVQLDFNFEYTGLSDEAKRILEKVSGLQYTVKSVNLPSFTIGNDKERATMGGNTVVPIPGVLDWTPVKITFADFLNTESKAKGELKKNKKKLREIEKDGISGDEEKLEHKKLSRTKKFNSLYTAILTAYEMSFGKKKEYREKVYEGSAMMSFERFAKIWNSVIIISADGDGNEIEKWWLKNPYPTSFENASLSYEDDAIRTFSVELDYVTAEYEYWYEGEWHKVFKSSNKVYEPTMPEGVKVDEKTGAVTIETEAGERKLKLTIE